LDKITPKLGEYIESKRNEGWQYGEGYIKGKVQGKTEKQIKRGFSKADWLFEKPSIITRTFTEDEHYKTEINYGIELFQAPRTENKNIFRSPHIIIHESIGKNNIPVIYLDGGKDLIFKHRFTGIFSPDKNKLFEIYDYLKNKNPLSSRLFVYISSGEILVKKERVITKEDIDSLPYPEDKKELELSEIEKVWRDDVLDYYIHQAKVPQSNPLNSEPKDQKKQLQEYGNVFCKVMNASYGSKQNYSFKQGNSFETNSYIATCFHYTDKEIQFSFIPKTEKDFKEYFEKQTGKNQRITRIVKLYLKDEIWFIKPKQLRYWLKSIGDRDAIDCFTDFLTNKQI